MRSCSRFHVGEVVWAKRNHGFAEAIIVAFTYLKPLSPVGSPHDHYIVRFLDGHRTSRYASELA